MLDNIFIRWYNYGVLKERGECNMDKRKIIKICKDGKTKEIEVDWDKMPCRKCDRRYHFCCPKADCWNKKGEYCVY